MTNVPFDLTPTIAVPDTTDARISRGWEAVARQILDHASGTVAIESYQGVDVDRIVSELRGAGHPALTLVDTRTLMKKPGEIEAMVRPDITDDPVFGRITRLTLRDFFPETIHIPTAAGRSRLVVAGPGAGLLLPEADTTVYADMPRWEIQQRQRRGLVDKLGLGNCGAGAKELYKRSFFVDWRVLDIHKKTVLPRSDFYLESVAPEVPVLVPTATLMNALRNVVRRPFKLKPFFDPGVWGGQWMRRVCGLDTDAPNYAWCFNCVPEENSLIIRLGEVDLEIPALNLVFFRTRELLGEPVEARFGTEFPIRFDFLDTIEGQNLSFQVHPSTQYIRDHFGMNYTQDESYYILAAKPGAVVYLGLREGVDSAQMRADLEAAQRGDRSFPAEEYVQTWPVQPHDHLLIPAGTPHCSGAESVVLEISATPYIFTFKLWDWGRVDLDGTPRPINIQHGWENIRWDRTTAWTRKNLVNRAVEISRGEGWREERTGLHELEFIETRRHWFSVPVAHDTGSVEMGTVHVLNLVEGQEVTITSDDGRFAPYRVQYAETVVIPAAVGRYTVRPSGPSAGRDVATVRASVRTGINCDGSS